MANIKSQIKRNRQNEARRQRNKATRSELKTRRRNAENAARNGDEAAVELHRVAVKRIDQAAAKGVIHKNKASNLKRKLAKRVNALAKQG